jgi:hypothetical protein
VRGNRCRPLRALPVAFCSIIAFFTPTAAEAPKDCYFDCKKQFEFLESFRGTVNENKLQSLFGAPKIVTKGKRFELTQYKGNAFDFLALKDLSTKKILGHAVYYYLDGGTALGNPERKNAAHIPLPGIARGGVAYTIATVTEAVILDKCNGPVQSPQGKYRYAWTSACHFDATPQNLSILLLLSGGAYDCSDQSPSFNSIKALLQGCKFEKEIHPIAYFIASDAKLAGNLADVTSNWIFWRYLGDD